MTEKSCKDCVFKYLEMQDLKPMWRCIKHKLKTGSSMRIPKSKLACHFFIESNFKFEN